MSSAEERARRYADFLIRRAWAISIVLALIGFGLILPLLEDPISWRSLVVLMVSWLILTVTIRFAARQVPKMFFPEER
jgi:hypothetical protein